MRSGYLVVTGIVRLRADVSEIAGYVPGRQPLGDDWIKLNTNESPEVSPAALVALRAAVGEGLRRYPDPLSGELRRRIARRHAVEPDMVIVGNGSDDVLNLLVRVVCDPGDRVVAATPSYSLYPVLAALQGAELVELPLGDQFSLPARQMAAARGKLTFVASPNNPAGTHYAVDLLRWLAERTNLLVIDEAYVEFADGDRMDLVRDLDNVCVTRSLSKAFGLAGVRIGYGVARPEIIEALLRVKDSYNVSRFAQAAGAAALADTDWAEAHWQGIRQRREAFGAELQRRFGLTVYPSQANFLLVECAPHDAADVQAGLESRRILVRRFAGEPRVANALRISIGSEAEMQAVISALADMLGGNPTGGALGASGIATQTAS